MTAARLCRRRATACADAGTGRDCRVRRTGSGRSGGAAHRSELAARARAAARESANGPHRRLLRRRFDHAALGRDRLPRAPGELEAELLRLERRQLRLGRRPDREHPVASRERRARRRQPQGHRAPRPAPTTSGRGPADDEQGRRDHARPDRDRRPLPQKAPGATIILTGDLPAQRQHGGDAGDRSRSTRISRAWPTAAASATSTSTTSSPTKTAGCSTA